MSVGFKGQQLAIDTINANLGTSTPTNVYIALFTVAPTPAGGGTEVSGTGYSRLLVPNNRTNFPAATSSSVIANALAWAFGTVGSGGWGTVVWAAVVNTASGALGTSDIRYAGPLTSSRVTVAGDTFTINAGQATFTEL